MAVYASLSFSGWAFLLFLLAGQKKKITKRKTAGFCFETATFLRFFASKLKPDFLLTD